MAYSVAKPVYRGQILVFFYLAFTRPQKDAYQQGKTGYAYLALRCKGIPKQDAYARDEEVDAQQSRSGVSHRLNLTPIDVASLYADDG